MCDRNSKVAHIFCFFAAAFEACYQLRSVAEFTPNDICSGLQQELCNITVERFTGRCSSSAVKNFTRTCGIMLM